MKLIEWFFNLLLSKKAKEVKQEAFIERRKAITKYTKEKNANDKIMRKYSSGKRFVK